ncbi:MAG: hypothetical protein RLZZ164_68 [Actinomycetota bacterium]|jgi:hypothetical protein
MKKIFWFATGIAAGLAMAKRIAEDPKAQALVDDAAKRARDFGSAVSEGFKERETELSAPKKTTRKPAAKKPAAKKPAVRKPAAKKPAAK